MAKMPHFIVIGQTPLIKQCRVYSAMTPQIGRRQVHIGVRGR